MPCGGIYPIKGSFVERFATNVLCVQCDKPECELWVEEWDGGIHKACVEEYLTTPEGKIIIDHGHEIILEYPRYTLEGREVPETPHDRCVGRAPCIFCGTVIGHFNDDDGTGWLLGAVVDGAVKYYLYCNNPVCPEVKQHGDAIWRCGCVPDYVESVGEQCHACKRKRADAVPVVP